MSESFAKSFLHEDGYVELVLVGQVNADEHLTMVQAAFNLVDKHGPVNLLVNGKNGRLSRDARTMSALMQGSRTSKLRHLFILTGAESGDPNGVKGPSVVASVIIGILGLSPIYIDNETEARQRAATN